MAERTKTQDRKIDKPTTPIYHDKMMITGVSRMKLSRDKHNTETLLDLTMDRKSAQEIIDDLTKQLKENQAGYPSITLKGFRP